jgi:hypothetical protein
MVNMETTMVSEKVPLRLVVPTKDRDIVRILAARSGLPMSQWCERVIAEAIAKERVFKTVKE